VVPENFKTPSQGWFSETPQEREVSANKIFKGKYKPKLEFPKGLEEGEFKPKFVKWEVYRYFLEQHSETI